MTDIDKMSQEKYHNPKANTLLEMKMNLHFNDLKRQIPELRKAYPELNFQSYKELVLKPEIDKVENEINDAKNFIIDQLKTTEQTIDEINRNNREINELARENINSRVITENEINNVKDSVKAFKASIIEELKLNEARKLWTARSQEAMVSFIGSCVLLAFLLIIIPAIAVFNYGNVLGFFKSIGDAVISDNTQPNSDAAMVISTISRLVLITLPVMLYVWLIRIVVRFNMRSLLLMDDARQRNTMLETYLHLVEQDVATKADRPIVLEALFRRTPGHGPDSIEPPNLTDIIRLSKGNSSTQ